MARGKRKFVATTASSTATSPSIDSIGVTPSQGNTDATPSQDNNDATPSQGATDVTTSQGVPPIDTSGERSWVWGHFVKCMGMGFETEVRDGKKVKVEKMMLKAKCTYCHHMFACNPNGGGTSSYAKHLNHHCPKYKPTAELNQMTLGGDSSKNATTVNGDVRAMLVSKVWSQEGCVKAIVRFIVIDEQPFSIVEKKGFRQMMEEVQPRLYVPSRRSIVREFWRMYDDMKDALMRDLRKYRVSFTTDTWTSVQNINYMVLTAHFVDDDWVLHKRIINFCEISSHQGIEIGKLIEQCLVEWKIEKIMCISVDNASANKVAIDWLVRKMKNWPISPLILSGKHIHVRCLAHVSNIIVRDGLKKLEGSVASIRKAVKFVRSSPARLAYFKKCIKIEKIECSGYVVMDVATRWNSTFHMLESVLKFSKVFDRMYEDENTSYRSYFEEKDDDSDDEEESGKAKKKVPVHPPMEEDWNNATTFCSFLKVFYLITMNVSASKHPTSHTAFHHVIAMDSEIDKLFAPEYMQVGSEMEQLLMKMAASMRSKYAKYFGTVGSTNRLFVVALILDPRFKLRYYLLLCKKKMGFTDAEVEAEGKAVKAFMKELCDAYVEEQDGPQMQHNQKDTQNSSDTNSSSATQLLPGCGIHDELMDDWERELQGSEDVVLSDEVESYLIDRLEANDKTVMFDILKWWKIKGTNSYPTLALVAKDILAIQVSTVASESAFSTGGRVIDPFRSSLTPKSVEALICFQNWLGSESIYHIEYEATEKEMEFYQELEKEHELERGEQRNSTVQSSGVEMI